MVQLHQQGWFPQPLGPGWSFQHPIQNQIRDPLNEKEKNQDGYGWGSAIPPPQGSPAGRGSPSRHSSPTNVSLPSKPPITVPVVTVPITRVQAQPVKTSIVQAQPVQTPPVLPSSIQAPPVQSQPDKISPVQVPPSDGDIEAGDNLTIDEGGEEDALLNAVDDRSTITDSSQITELLNDIQK